MKNMLLALLFLRLPALLAHAQTSGHLGMRLEVLPSVLRVTVTSALLDFGSQRADAGHVFLDPVSGEITTKVAGSHRLGEVRLTGPPHGAYAVSVAPTSALRRQARDDDRVRFRLRWARNDDCRPGGFEEVHDTGGAEGTLGPQGCSVVRFGGAITLLGAAEGRYEGSVHVRIFSL